MSYISRAKTIEERTQDAVNQVLAGAFLLKLRHDKDLALAQVCEHVSCSVNYLSEIERGKKLPSDYLIRELADFYEISEADLFQQFGKVPLTAREELESNPTLQRTLLEIRKKTKLTEDQKQRLYDHIYQLYRDFMDDIDEKN